MANELEQELASVPIPDLVRRAVRPEPGWEYSSVLPLKSRKLEPGEQLESEWDGLGIKRLVLGDKVIERAMPQIAQDLAVGWAQLMEGPGRAGAYLRGEPGVTMGDVVPPNAIMSIAGPGTVAGRVGAPTGALGTFAGPRAKTADLEALVTAQRVLEKAARDPAAWEKVMGKGVDVDEQVWRDLGWGTKFADKKPRFEISDAKATVKPEMFDLYKDSTLGSVLYHTDLYKNYPAMTRMPVRIRKGLGPNEAAYYPASEEIGIGYALPNKPEQFRLAILHEVQHAIDAKEGFARGGAPAEFWPKGFDPIQEMALAANNPAKARQIHEIYQKGLDRYKKLAGETTARLVEDRANLSGPAQRSYAPWKHMDVPLAEQEVRLPNGESARLVPVKGNPFRHVPLVP